MSEIDKTAAVPARSFAGMDQRLSVTTLGVEDVSASTACYQRLGCEAIAARGSVANPVRS